MAKPTPNEGPSTGSTFSYRENADKAIATFQSLAGQLDNRQAKEAYIDLVVGRGFSKSKPLYHAKSRADKCAPGTKPRSPSHQTTGSTDASNDT
jgi:hypothetical protein